jgi:hypothetical protein
MRRFGVGVRSFTRSLRDPAFVKTVEPLLTSSSVKESKPSGEALRILALLQREGRLVDFLMEDIHGASPDQIMAAVRDIHPQCQTTLKKHVELSPVLPQQEGEAVEIPTGFDPSAIRLVGNVSGQPPFRGTLQHSGWRVNQIKLPPLPEGQDSLVLMPAEVEIA